MITIKEFAELYAVEIGAEDINNIKAAMKLYIENGNTEGVVNYADELRVRGVELPKGTNGFDLANAVFERLFNKFA